jgi:hypothetical protein
MFQVHFTPRGTPQTDRSEIGLVFADPQKIRKEMTAIATINNPSNPDPKKVVTWGEQTHEA